MTRTRSMLVLFAAAMWVLTACNPTGTPEPPPDPQALLEKAAVEIQSISSLNFKLSVKGAPAYINTDVGIKLEMDNARGSYVSPDRVSATVNVRYGGATTEADIVAIGKEQYTKHSLLTLGRWLKIPFAPGFNADTLIGSDKGIRRALKSLRDLKLIGREDLYGTAVYHLNGRAAITDISAITVNLIQGTGDGVVDVYIAVDSGRVDQMILTQPDTATAQYPDPTRWTMELFDYGDTSIKVEIPSNAAEGTFVTPVPTPGGLSKP